MAEFQKLRPAALLEAILSIETPKFENPFVLDLVQLDLARRPRMQLNTYARLLCMLEISELHSELRAALRVKNAEIQFLDTDSERLINNAIRHIDRERRRVKRSRGQ